VAEWCEEAIDTLSALAGKGNVEGNVVPLDTAARDGET
jgi:hypothetical protein